MKNPVSFYVYCLVIALFLSVKANATFLHTMPVHKRSACFLQAYAESQMAFPKAKFNDARITYDLFDADGSRTVTYIYRTLPQRQVSVVVFDANCNLEYTKVSANFATYLEWIGRSDIANTLHLDINKW